MEEWGLLPHGGLHGGETVESASEFLRVLQYEKSLSTAHRPLRLRLANAGQLAQDILQNGQKSPILVRRDGNRFVLVEGLHRLEACKALGEETILGYLVQAAKH